MITVTRQQAKASTWSLLPDQGVVKVSSPENRGVWILQGFLVRSRFQNWAKLTQANNYHSFSWLIFQVWKEFGCVTTLERGHLLLTTECRSSRNGQDGVPNPTVDAENYVPNCKAAPALPYFCFLNRPYEVMMTVIITNDKNLSSKNRNVEPCSTVLQRHWGPPWPLLKVSESWMAFPASTLPCTVLSRLPSSMLVQVASKTAESLATNLVRKAPFWTGWTWSVSTIVFIVEASCHHLFPGVWFRYRIARSKWF